MCPADVVSLSSPDDNLIGCIGRVASRSNPADGPSRLELEMVTLWGAVCTPPVTTFEHGPCEARSGGLGKTAAWGDPSPKHRGGVGRIPHTGARSLSEREVPPFFHPTSPPFPPLNTGTVG